MDAFASMTTQLQARPAVAAPEFDTDTRPESKAARMRRDLRENGRQNAKALALIADCPSGQVSSILRHDIKEGRIRLDSGWYEWNFNHAGRPRGLDPGQEAITWYEADAILPDSELTVLVRTQGCAEPVWLGFYDGEGWRDLDGQPITVIRWADMPKGGEDPKAC